MLALPAVYVPVLLLVFRALAGLGWMQHGLMKARGGGWKQAGQWIKTMGVPSAMAPLVTLMEVLGGAFLVVGLIVPVVALLFFVQMLGIVLMMKLKMKATFLRAQPTQPSYEVEFLYMIIALVLVAVGAGSLSLDGLLGLF
jgi:putative oxidoreductase